MTKLVACCSFAEAPGKTISETQCYVVFFVTGIDNHPSLITSLEIKSSRYIMLIDSHDLFDLKHFLCRSYYTQLN
jgi:hypothetical protein